MGIAITAARMMSILIKLGFRFVGQVGSHAHLEKIAGKIWRVTVPMHGKDLPIGTLRSILKQAGISMADFLRVLGRK